MKLADLDGQLLKITSETSHQRGHPDVATADGVWFLCPKCVEQSAEGMLGHGVICWACHVPPERSPKPGRWSLRGTSIADLTLDTCPGKSRSVLLLGGCAWHGFITNGEVTGA